jgi:hypothetical protein
MTAEENRREASEKIKALQEWFASAELPAGPVKLCPGVVIVDVNKFVETSLARLESMELRGKTLQMSYTHLTDFKKIIEKS